MKRLATVLILSTLVLALLACGAAAAGAAGLAAHAPRTVTHFSPGHYGSFAEGMAADSHGNLWVSVTTWGLYDDSVNPPVVTSDTGKIWRVTPAGHKTLKASMDLTPNGFLLGVAVQDDQVYVALYDGGAGGISPGVYRLGSHGKLSQVVKLPEGAWPNGIAFHGSALYITDSGAGAVWRATLGARKVTLHKPWLTSRLLKPGDPEADASVMGIGVNGIAFRGDRLYVSVADYGRVVRVPIGHDGSAGKPVVVVKKAALKTADGIAFDARGGLWITTDSGTTGASPSGGLYRLTPKGALQTKADDPGWLNYPTTPVFGTAKGDTGTLFVENGAFYGASGDGTAPDIRALHVGIPGLPLR